MEKNINHFTQRHVSQNNDFLQLRNKNEENTSPNKKYEEVLFLHIRKEASLQYRNKKTNTDESIVFRDRAYSTNDPEQIKYLRGLVKYPSNEVYEKEFPKEIIQEMEYEASFVTNDPDAYDDGKNRDYN